jgi:UDP-N-acetylglucosamine--N-acetylmuramyl-(pentapeptide) pyrophosphoryl-undecaprenol N-acetylglucosamine transferase
MPVRTMFQPLDPAPCRTALGLDPDKPVLLVMGGSQGASPLNRVVLQTLSAFAAHEPSLQFLHLTGPAEVERVRQAYEHHRRRAVVHPFLTEMDLAFGAATVAVTRAGASSLAEQAAMRVPSVLIPYPQAADDHQDHNARAFVETGAARMLRQAEATPEALLREVRGLLHDAAARCALQAALGSWHQPDAAERIAQRLLNPLAARTARSRPDALPPRMGLDPLTPEPSSTHSHARPD